MDRDIGRLGFGRATLWNCLKRGFRRTCPRCGRGQMFAGYLTIKENCPRCGLAFEPLRADDAPAYFTLSIVGHVVVSGYLTSETLLHPPAWLQAAIWLPATLIMTLALLPYVKGAVMGAIFCSQTKHGSFGS
ncbi:MAG: DUF983 domain-containing protein [Dongiaceae bacterium]